MTRASDAERHAKRLATLRHRRFARVRPAYRRACVEHRTAAAPLIARLHEAPRSTLSAAQVPWEERRVYCNALKSSVYGRPLLE